MRILILEDEERSGNYLEDLLHQYDNTLSVVGKIPSVQKAIQWLMKNDAPDIIMMDIHLEDALVFQLFEEVRITTPIIFTTAYDEYMIRAFKVNSIDYLLKPVQLTELATALDKYKSLQKHFSQFNYEPLAELVRQKSPVYKERFMITAGSKILSVEAKNVAYFILESKITHLVTLTAQKLVIAYSLEDLTELLNPTRFFRVNRQCIVSVESVVSAQSYSSGKMKVTLQPVSSQEVFVSGDRVPAFKEWMGK